MALAAARPSPPWGSSSSRHARRSAPTNWVLLCVDHGGPVQHADGSSCGELASPQVADMLIRLFAGSGFERARRAKRSTDQTLKLLGEAAKCCVPSG